MSHVAVQTAAPAAVPQRHKAAQRRLWDAAAPELGAWWPDFERFMRPVTAAMLQAARLDAAARVVDLASGFGEPALSAARAVGRHGHVLATDLSSEMLAVAEARARAAGVTNVAFAEMDAEEPTLPDASADALTCRLGLMFLPNLDAALRRLVSVLVPGGRLVAAVWGPPKANQWLTVASRTLTEFLELSPPPGGAPGIFDLSGPGVAERAFALAGLVGVRTTTVPLDLSWPSPAAYAAFHEASPMRGMVLGEERSRRDQAWREVAATAERRWGSGPLRLRGEILVVSGRRRAPLAAHS